MIEGNPVRWKDATIRGASITGIALLLVCLCILTDALAARPAVAEELVSDKWQFSVSPYMWFLSLKGDVTVQGQEAEGDMDFSDLWDHLNFAGMVEIEARKNRLGVFVSPMFSQLEVSKPRVNLTVDMNIIGFGGFYRLGPWPLRAGGGLSGPVLVTDIYAGGRYTFLKSDLKLNLPNNPRFVGSKNWVDPIIGVRTLWFLTPRWMIVVAGDIGGGTGSSSDFQWMVTGLVGYSFHLLGDDHATVFAGYRALGQDYADGSGADRFEWDETMYGPMVGLAYHF
ncbi:MAG: hypothetical protein WCF31_05175 [Candidatus Deferrimicrobiaceae bacterium]